MTGSFTPYDCSGREFGVVILRNGVTKNLLKKNGMKMKKKNYDTAARLQHIEEGIAKGPFRADWESLSHLEVPAWFRREKLGIFIHWGPYSVPAFANEWYSRNMYIEGTPEYEHHIKTYGPQKKFGYKDFIPKLTAEHFNAEEWIRLFREAGAGYVFPVAEHHDGFQMYKSDLSKWNAVNMGPKRDVLGELSDAAKKAGMHFCTSSHRAEHWWFMGHGMEFDSDISAAMQQPSSDDHDFYWPAMPERDNFDMESEPAPTDEFLTDWLIRTVELVDRYQPELIYFDWWIQHKAFEPYLKKFLAYYYNQGIARYCPVAVCYKHEALAFGAGIPEVERGIYPDAKPYAWQTDTAVAWNSWCYTDSLDYKDSRTIIGTLIDVVSRNGNLLLNIGPKADGTIPAGDRKILTDLAAWMKVNGEAIRGARPWRISREGSTTDKQGSFSEEKKEYTEQDFRFTVVDGKLYIFVMKYPESGKVKIQSLGRKGTEVAPAFLGHIKTVTLLGVDEPRKYAVKDEGLEVELEVPMNQSLHTLIHDENENAFFPDKELPLVLCVEMK